MSNASSSYLRGANAGRGRSGEPQVDETAILGAIVEHGAKNIAAVASVLSVSPTLVADMVARMERKKLLLPDQATLKLSSAGERAFRYAKMAKL